MVDKLGYQVAGHLRQEEIYELKRQGYRLLVSEPIDYRVRRGAVTRNRLGIRVVS